MNEKAHTWAFGSRQVKPTIALLFGIVLIFLGGWLIYSARHMHSLPPVGMELVYYDWDTNYLLTGMALALVGTASASASETYRLVTRKLKNS